MRFVPCRSVIWFFNASFISLSRLLLGHAVGNVLFSVWCWLGYVDLVADHLFCLLAWSALFLILTHRLWLTLLSQDQCKPTRVSQLARAAIQGSINVSHCVCVLCSDLSLWMQRATTRLLVSHARLATRALATVKLVSLCFCLFTFVFCRAYCVQGWLFFKRPTSDCVFCVYSRLLLRATGVVFVLDVPLRKCRASER